jgi:hypothetical protein
MELTDEFDPKKAQAEAEALEKERQRALKIASIGDALTKGKSFGHYFLGQNPQQFDTLGDVAKVTSPMEEKAKELRGLVSKFQDRKRAEALAQRKKLEDMQLFKMKADYNHALQEETAKNKNEQERREYSNVGGWRLKPGATPTMDDAKQFKEAAVSAGNMSKAIDDLMSLVNQHGTEVAPTQAKSLMQAKLRDIQMLAKSPALYQLGVLTGPDMQILEQVTSDPTSWASHINPWGGDNAIKNLQALKGNLGRNLQARSKVYGFEAADPDTQALVGAQMPEADSLTQGMAKFLTRGGKAMANPPQDDGLDKLSDEELEREFMKVKGSR